MFFTRKKWGVLCAVLGVIPVISPLASATDIHFDYTSFDNSNAPGADPHFGQTQFNVLNYPSIDGNYMMTSTDAHRPEMVANNNALAEFYNFFLVDYNTQVSGSGLNASAEADAINAYVNKHSTSNGPRPSWLILNEISASTWPNTTQTGTDYRAWVIATVTRLHETYGYDVVTYSPFANPQSLGSDWRALAAESYIGIEDYLSGAGVMSHGTDYASRVAWAEAQYAWPKTAFGDLGISSSRLFLGEDFSNTSAGTPYGRSGLSAADWDSVIQIRQDAIYQAGYTGFLAYAWGANEMGITEAEQLEHEYYYRSRLVLPGQQPQWLSDGQINLNGTLEPLSWNYALNWLGGVPNTAGAVANFYRTNTTARTITLDGAMTVGTLTFDSPNSYTIAPGTGGTLTFSGSNSSLSVIAGSHSISAGVVLGNDLSVNLTGNLTLSGGITTNGHILTKTGLGTLTISGAQSDSSGSAIAVTAGTLNLDSDAGSSASANLSLSVTNATVNIGAREHLASLYLNNANAAVHTTGDHLLTHSFTLLSGSTLDLSSNDLIVNYTGSSPLGLLRAALITGYHNGAWNGAGIISTAAGGNGAHATALGYAEAFDVLGLSALQTTTYDGETIDATTALVKYTWLGDTDLNGQVNAADLSNMAPAGTTNATWQEGDFNYDGIINSDDYSLLLLGFAEQTGSFPAVPEPSSIRLITAGSLLLAGRRRRCRGALMAGSTIPGDFAS